MVRTSEYLKKKGEQSGAAEIFSLPFWVHFRARLTVVLVVGVELGLHAYASTPLLGGTIVNRTNYCR